MAADTLLRCPPHAVVADFLAGRLPAGEADAVAAHVSGCGRCSPVPPAAGPPDGGSDPTARLRPGSISHPAGPALPPTSGGAGGTTPAPVVPERAARAVGPYTLLARIGSGGMGVVYRAEHRTLRRPTALKLIHPGWPASDDARGRFRTEARAAARLQHPNIVRVYDFDEFDGRLYLGMELVEGGSLAARLLGGGPLAARAAAGLVRDLAGAMAYAHANGVVHRDLKPANVLMDGDTPKVADFGLAKLGDDAGAATPPGEVLGTPAYMAPEQVEARAAEVGERTDVYALGVVLYETLTGRLPFCGTTKIETLRLVARGGPPPPSRWRDDLPPDLVAVCLRCLERNPRDRYPSARDLADDLARWLAGEPTVARPPSAVRKARRWVRARAKAAGVAMGFVLALAGAVAAERAFLGARPPNGPVAAWEWDGTLPPTPPDAARARQQLEEQLARGGAVRLAGADAPPAYYRVLDVGRGRLDRAEGGAIAVTAGPTACLVELAPAPEFGRFRLRAQVRHRESRHAGKVGLYFAYRTATTAAATHHLYGWLGYNDIRSARKEAAVRLGDRVQPPADVFDFPTLAIDRIWSRAAGGPVGSVGSNLAAGEPFEPREAGDVWRDLEIVVTPETVRASFAGRPAGEATAAAAARIAADLAAFPHLRDPADAPAPGLAFDPAGGIGLVVRSGAAAFRSVVLEPLPETR